MINPAVAILMSNIMDAMVRGKTLYSLGLCLVGHPLHLLILLAFPLQLLSTVVIGASQAMSLAIFTRAYADGRAPACTGPVGVEQWSKEFLRSPIVAYRRMNADAQALSSNLAFLYRPA
jgi:hypothetical protein